MSHMNLFERAGDAVLEAIRSGASIEDAATSAGTAGSTVKGWLRRGRDNAGGRYGDFATAVDAALEARQLPPEGQRPVDRDELLILVSKAARGGSVQAMRLASEILAGDPGDDDDPVRRFEQ